MSGLTQYPRLARATFHFSVLSLASLLAGVACSAAALGVGLDEIPNPRPTGWTTDLTGRIPPDTVTALNRLGDQVQQQTGAQLMVVVIGSTQGVDPHQFATDLYNRWQIGQAGKSNGVLVFAALDDRKAEIILGDGVSTDAQVQASRQIMQDVILPKFKQGDPGAAVFHGARACAEQILGVSLEPLQAEAPVIADQRPAPVLPAPAIANPPPPAPPVVVQRVAAVPQHRSPIGPLAWLFGGTGGVAAVIFGARKLWRYHVRQCVGCGAPMTRLSEAADDQYLTPGERTEERLGSVDYDVWSCGVCGQTQKFRYGAFFTRYSRCPQCRSKTKSSVKRTVRAATYSQGGLIEIEDFCHNCQYRNVRTHGTPMLTDTTTASTALWASGASTPSAPSTSFTSFDAGAAGGHSSGAGASGGW
ncbi:MAG TPA: TPM domain-containing protein [Pirellulales bacterium]|nr:TPM domain-containing protein [Pirellulales bacterium]